MSTPSSTPEQAMPDPAADGRPNTPYRVGPRPIDRPPADPASAAAFGRPAGVDGAFAAPPNGGPGVRAFADLKVAPPPPEALVTAFRRPDGRGEVLQRPPGSAIRNGDDAEAALV